MSGFERKIKYTVFKIKDAKRYLSANEQVKLNELLEVAKRFMA